MVRRIQALNYRCLRHVDVRLEGNFHILVGPNASGKSTLLDVIAFFADLTSGSIEGAVRRRVPDFRDLVWGRQGNGRRFELALELDADAASEDSEGEGAHSRFPGHALTPTGVMAIRCKQFHLPDL